MLGACDRSNCLYEYHNARNISEVIPKSVGENMNLNYDPKSTSYAVVKTAYFPECSDDTLELPDQLGGYRVDKDGKKIKEDR